VAYTLYDDFLDDEGSPVTLPLANMALRELVLLLERDPAPGLGVVATRQLDCMETANAWEVSHCRIKRQTELLTVAPPDYGDLSRLADRSIGHSLGCTAMLLELGYGAESVEVRAVEQFFHHFLIARQLSDEAHDWKSDLHNGHINAVGAMLLAGQPKRGRNVAALYERLEKSFWERELLDACDLMDSHIASARRALREAQIITRPDFLEALLAPLARASDKARHDSQQTLQFLKGYASEYDE
jgi:hypothetical protein